MRKISVFVSDEIAERLDWSICGRVDGGHEVTPSYIVEAALRQYLANGVEVDLEGNYLGPPEGKSPPYCDFKTVHIQQKDGTYIAKL